MNMNEHIASTMNEIPIPTNLHDRCELGIDRAAHDRKGQITMLKFRKSTVAAAVGRISLISKSDSVILIESTSVISCCVGDRTQIICRDTKVLSLYDPCFTHSVSSPTMVP